MKTKDDWMELRSKDHETTSIQVGGQQVRVNDVNIQDGVVFEGVLSLYDYQYQKMQEEQ